MDQSSAKFLFFVLTFVHCFDLFASQSSSSYCQDDRVLANGFVTYSVGRFYSQTQLVSGVTKRFNCHRGFVLVGPSSASCSRGRWASRTPKCVPDSCTELDEDANNYLAVYYTEDPVSRGKYSHGVKAQVYCLWEMIPVAGEIFTKCINGNWVPHIPLCLSRDLVNEPCVLEDNSIPEAVTITNQHEIKEGGIIPHYGVLEFRCHPGYSLQGSSITTCVDSKWSQQFPICTADADYETCGQTSGNPRSRPRGNRRKGPRPARVRRIVDGVDAEDATWPWQVAIYVKDPNYEEWHYRCGGSLISPEWVLSAAHCFAQNEDVPSIQIRLGLTHRVRHANRPREQKMGLDGLYIHQYYNWVSFIDYDVALLHLATPAVLSPFVRTVCLPDVYTGSNFEETLGLVKENVFGMVIGWGYSESIFFANQSIDGAIEYNKKLQQLEVPIKKNITCIKSLDQRGEDPGYFTERMFCAGYSKRGRGPCFGDSGGPVMIEVQTPIVNSTEVNSRWVQIGIASSTSTGCAIKGVYTHYTDVPRMMYWIDDVLNSNHTPFHDTITLFI